MRKFLGFLILFFTVVFISVVNASDLTSTSFIIRDPVIGTGGGYGTSTNFKLFSEGDTTLTGIGSSTNFIGHYGFLYFPFVTDVVLSAVPNGADADLSWPAAVSATGLGWTVAGYNTGINPNGGGYTYTDVGNVLLYSYTGLAPGNYCFMLQTYDALGYVIATSNEVCLTISAVITFDLDTATTDTESGPSYTVPLGILTTGAVTRSNGSINSIWTDLDTNAPGGAVVTVLSANGGLASASVPADTILSSSGVMSAGTAKYGLCIASATATTGSYVKVSPYNGAPCVDGAVNDIGIVDGTVRNMFNTAGAAVYGARSQIRVNATISPITPAHNDYEDNLTFIATGTF